MSSGSDRVALGPDELAVDAATAWASVPAAGAVVVFLGIVRDHADGREGVTALTYEAYEAENSRKSKKWKDENPNPYDLARWDKATITMGYGCLRK